MVKLTEWFLTGDERGNPATRIPAWSEGNSVEPLIHGANYFERLATEVEALSAGDYVYFTDWRGDPDQLLRDDGPTIRDLFCQAAQRGVVVKGLVWRSHLDKLQYSEEENEHLGEAIEAAGGEVLLDQRVRMGGSHHQKLVVIRHPEAPQRDIAFAGGIDLCHSRRDDESHDGDPQAVRMAKCYGSRPPWHDVQLQIRGPAVGALDTAFRERWNDPAPLDTLSPVAWLMDKVRGADLSPGRLPEQPSDPPVCGPHAVQVLRTYPDAHFQFDFAPHGERSIARAYNKVVPRARRLIYVEDQYLWSARVATLFANALRDNPDLHLVAVIPRYPDVDGRLQLPPNLVGRWQAIATCQAASPERVHIFDVENHRGTPVYVHAKVCVIDDIWACVGSDNLNRRSWTHDSELSCAVIDPEGSFARDLRLRLLREHLDRNADGSQDGSLVDPTTAVRDITAAAEALDAWYTSGCRGTRPPGRLRPHKPERLSWHTRAWAEPLYRLIYDPDGRSVRDRLRDRL
ncbi:phosphatidylserine/phosphatidylglycerophosphate/cardiolipin synthase-like enzyme [Mycolicibacterium sp. BK556]|uniref:phospholipase D family protein n=1 Tax=Mycobacteriaceae TaxID=1762 RepID=UPI00105FAAF8|nr:phospholipase D-like domain-containing protein [Mycobacterium sp. BK086]MBB3603790.1 phosphatidylserine/phosphatidylglycerophosphate/cardiolipin synthase-like enzyme [Mycolicibacterium sp. BK556]MBB3633985.1 phosphatidylserine/phosphatidylglycerophosphate/cardiolipin synthase-like enzyme [Mycolicibacterium sp. BK607]MBB3751567.1 phosphatidylserine/phosphatidylglycerophosphate/cardiolipin synthase-like enzyme [Mycolicibacterium sp. BK634]